MRVWLASVATIAWAAAFVLAQSGGVDPSPPNAPWQSPAFAGQTRAPARAAGVSFDVVTLVNGLEHPWGLAFLPAGAGGQAGRMLVTERQGRMRIVSADGRLSDPLGGLPPVDARDQGGLLGLAIDANASDVPRAVPRTPGLSFPAVPGTARTGPGRGGIVVYWVYAEPHSDGTTNTAVARGTLVEGFTPRIDNVQVIYRQAPQLRSTAHYGGRVVIASDGTLFITQGERSIVEGRLQAERLDGLLGKIVRINKDGSIPGDNPFVGRADARGEIWSIGHRNVQAATINPLTGELWEVEHGTAGGDEVNIARKGKDYGWPTIAYGVEYNGSRITGGITQKERLEQPLYYWDPVIAPSGMTFYTGDLFPGWKSSAASATLFVGGLASTSLVRLTVSGERVVDEERLLTDLQPRRERIRDVVQGPEGALYVLTDEDRGRLLKIVPRR
jgi:glucose/arabinose dehydrogenase